VAEILFGEYLRYHRLRASLTQDELADRAGISVRAIRDLERGRARAPQPRSVRNLVAGLALDETDGQQLIELSHVEPQPEPAQPSSFPVTGAVCPLPPLLPDLVGRARELEWLREQAEQALASQVMGVVVVHGAPGMGKTVLAVQAGYQLEQRFADGCLFLDMQGMDPEPVSAHQAALRLIRSLGVPEEQIPAAPDERLGLYRWLMRDRTVLLVLDNVVNEAQVRPLIATSPGTLALITSRFVLTGLDTARLLELDLLGNSGAVQLLSAITGRDRTNDEHDALAEVVRLCDGVPLALRIAGNRIASRPRWPVHQFAVQLADDRRRLSLLTAGDVQVRAAFELSHRLLTADAAEMFRRLSLVAGHEFGLELAAVVADQPSEIAEVALTELTDASLLRPADTPDRYTFHDLLRLFARERLEAEEDADDIANRVLRTSKWLLGLASTAARHFDLDQAVDQDVLAAFPDQASADAWLTGETSQWLWAYRLAARDGRHQEVLDAAHALYWYADHRGTGELWYEFFRAGLDAAEALDSPRDQAAMANSLTWVLVFLLFRTDEALDVHRLALRAARRADDQIQEAWANYFRAGIARIKARFDDALPFNERAVELFAAAGHSTGENLALTYLGRNKMLLGMFDEAVLAHRQAIAQQSSGGSGAGSDVGLAVMYRMLGDTLHQAGHLDEALDAFDHAIRLLAADATFGIADVRLSRGAVLKDVGRLEEAYQDLSFSLSAGRPAGEIRVLSMLAELCEEMKQPSLARDYLVRAVTLFSSRYFLIPKDQRELLASSWGIATRTLDS